MPTTGSATVRALSGWVDDAPGVQIKPMLDDTAGYRTQLMKVAPSLLGERHAHAEIEQVYVLEGDFFDEDGSYGPGDLVVRAAGAMHRSGSKGGCTMLLFYTPVVP